MSIRPDTSATQQAAVTTFGHIVVGIDGTPEAIEAARQAAALRQADGELVLLGAWQRPAPAAAHLGAPTAYLIDASLVRSGSETAVHDAATQLTPPPTGQVVVEGVASHALIREATTGRATLIAVGAHGRGRALGILLGSTTTEVVHGAPCSVLVARPASDRFPRKIVVGVDGSPHSEAALATARYLADRFDAELWPVTAQGGKGVDRPRVQALLGRNHEDLPDDPVTALLAAAADADLIVVGSRGLHGLRALGSVSERVAHRAHASTLVVRAAPPDDDDRPDAVRIAPEDVGL